MKRFLLVLAPMLLTIGAFAQGTINFANATSNSGLTPADRSVRFGMDAANGFLIPAGTLVSSNAYGRDLTGLRVALLYAPTTVTEWRNFQLATFNGDYPTFRSSTSANAGSWFSKVATLNGVTAGQTVNMAAMVWDINVAPSPLDPRAWSQGICGLSGIFTYTVPTGAYPPPSDFLPQNLRGFVTGIPEPTSLALVGLGASAMMIFRRRKD